jgi:hypothetical protein
MPAQQRLHADHLAVRETDLRLVVQAELVFGDRAPQLGFELLAALDLALHRLDEEAVGVAAVRLGAIERDVGVAQQLVRIGVVVGKDRDADADAGVHLVAVAADRLEQAGDDALRHVARIDRPVEAGQDDRELVAADPRDRIGVVDDALQAARAGTQQGVAGRVAERVVDVLEVV